MPESWLVGGVCPAHGTRGSETWSVGGGRPALHCECTCARVQYMCMHMCMYMHMDGYNMLYM